jgi:alpha-beta hydrolase superfamily lysophospholipase
VLEALARKTFRVLRFIPWLVLTVLATLMVVFAVQARLRLPDLEPWHRIQLAEEYRAGRPGAPQTFVEYQALEQRLADELRRRVLQDPAAGRPEPLNRFYPASVPGRLALDGPHNRSYELPPAGPPRGAVLLVHGLTDSPYSMRALAGIFRAQGLHVVALRLPGHGTIPAGLLDVDWEDWYAATVLAARHAAQRAGGGPLHGAGYSTGAALLALLAIRSVDDPSLPRLERLFTLSAAIGVSDFAALANVASALSFVPYFEKAKWLDVLPEYDPYKYNSFPVNAGNQVYQLTREVQRALAAARSGGRLSEMPRVLAFQSVVDATVSAADVVRNFLLRLPGPGNEFVAFDVNRESVLIPLLAAGPRGDFERIRNAPGLPFALTLVANVSGTGADVAAYRRDAGTTVTSMTPLGLAWPRGVFSVGHVALPFPIDDPVYGLQPAVSVEPAYGLGDVAPRGEAGALVIPLGNFARLRSNPFFDVIRNRIVATLESGQSPD